MKSIMGFNSICFPFTKESMRNAAIEKFSAPPPPPAETELPRHSGACDEANDNEGEEEEELEEDAEMLGDADDVD